MTLATRASAPDGTARQAHGTTEPGGRQGLITLGLLAAVIPLDQTTKWWGWRHAPHAVINSGGTWIIGRPVGAWFSGPVSGPLLDHLDIGLLSLAGLLLVRRRRRAPVLVSAALMLGGWSSNLLDRLGMHTLTAPGSVRGAVDFVPLGPASWNLADFFILGATVLFLLAACGPGARSAAASRPRAAVPLPVPVRSRRASLAAVGVLVTLVLGVPTAIRAGSEAAGGYSRPPSAVGVPDRE
jgi:lipoprotein signal peptidase